ncbi:MAG TPA: redox-regulated ATPase YchF [Thermomicrobiales bacterium]|nr:redox-regulated ATPase YchF [Thermomicrobiales bacterium]
MNLQLTIVGLPQSGKTTVFNALTRSSAAVGGYSTAADEPNLATVKVPDPRIPELSKIFNPRREVYADIRYLDVAGVARGLAEQGMGGRLLGYLQEASALILVVRAFDDPNVPHPEESVDPLRDLETLLLELSFSDLAIIERRLPRLEESIKKLRGPEREAQELERDVLLRFKTALESDTPLREVELEPEEDRAIRGYGFLTRKPVLVLFNLGEDQLGEPAEKLVAEARERFGRPGLAIDALAAKIEMEIAQLDPEDAELFMADLGIEESSLDRVIRLSYDLLGLITFLTVGEDEVRAWPIRRGMTAVEAAGEIHSDIQRGFIRAEIVSYEDLIEKGSLAECRKAGLLRVEGRDYVMQDGDVVHFLFNV